MAYAPENTISVSVCMCVCVYNYVRACVRSCAYILRVLIVHVLLYVCMFTRVTENHAL